MSEKPLDPVIEATIEQGIAPLLKRIEKDLGRSLSTSVIVFQDGLRGPTIEVGGSEEVSGTPAVSDGELRLRIRETYGGKRYVYSAEAVYNRTVSTTGFSGFVAKGEVLVADDARIDVLAKNWTVRYNVWEFSDD
jgi:hypothetical protein